MVLMVLILSFPTTWPHQSKLSHVQWTLYRKTTNGPRKYMLLHFTWS